MKKTIVALTGASGSMGSEVLKQIMESHNKFKVKVLLRKKRSNFQLARTLKMKYKNHIDIDFGDLSDYSDVCKFVKHADYVLHCAAIIPPTSDHYPKSAYKSNYLGTKNLVDAISKSKRVDEIKFVNVSTVALYGNRNHKHPWSRVGDPMMPSSYDYYAATKLKAERYVLDTDLPNWVSLRQTYILHKNMFANNMNDGLMFHTCWNVAFETVTAEDSGLMMKHLVDYDLADTLDKSFWKKCYNIGGGANNRVTGFEVFDSGFKLMGASAKDFFKPNWNVDRNFHGVWFYDSHDLEKHLHFQTESYNAYWQKMAKLNWYYKLGVIVPKPLLSKWVIQKLFKNTNSPKYWIENKHEGRIKAFYGSVEKIHKIGEDWSKYPLFCKGQTFSGSVNYENIKNIDNVVNNHMLLDHGYDESKPDSELGIEDMQSAAKFRGGKCLSTSMEKGDLYTKLEWECHDGHKFWSSPYTVLKAGYWCPDCCQPTPWKWGKLAQKIPFYAQVWYDANEKHEIDEFPINEHEDDFMFHEVI